MPWDVHGCISTPKQRRWSTPEAAPFTARGTQLLHLALVPPPTTVQPSSCTPLPLIALVGAHRSAQERRERRPPTGPSVRACKCHCHRTCCQGSRRSRLAGQRAAARHLQRRKPRHLLTAVPPPRRPVALRPASRNAPVAPAPRRLLAGLGSLWQCHSYIGQAAGGQRIAGAAALATQAACLRAHRRLPSATGSPAC